MKILNKSSEIENVKEKEKKRNDISKKAKSRITTQSLTNNIIIRRRGNQNAKRKIKRGEELINLSLKELET